MANGIDRTAGAQRQTDTMCHIVSKAHTFPAHFCSASDLLAPAAPLLLSLSGTTGLSAAGFSAFLLAASASFLLPHSLFLSNQRTCLATKQAI